MINLLPPEQKQELLQEEKLRLTLILGTLFLCFLICLSLILFLIKNYTLWDVEAEKILVQEKEKALSFNQELEKEMKESNIFLSNLASFYEEHIEVAGLLEAIEQTLPSGVYLTSFDFALPSRILIKGFAISTGNFNSSESSSGSPFKFDPPPPQSTIFETFLFPEGKCSWLAWV